VIQERPQIVQEKEVIPIRPRPVPAPRPQQQVRPVIQVRTIAPQPRPIAPRPAPRPVPRPVIQPVQIEQAVDADCERDGDCSDRVVLPVIPSRRPAPRPAPRPSVKGPEPEESHPAPEPYAYTFESVNEDGSKSTRTEEGDRNGMVKGSYGYTDQDGIYRSVEYYADETGFHAVVKTNEPGVESHNSADAEVIVE